MKEFFYRVLAWVVFAIIFCPLLLLLTEGENGEPTILNIIGLAYLWLLIIVPKLIMNKIK